jgi:hypothetical protein
MTAQNELTLSDFISDTTLTFDGLVLPNNKPELLKVIQNKLSSRAKKYFFVDSLTSLIASPIDNNSFVFVNLDDDHNISENESGELFRKIRGKIKLILYNKNGKTEQGENFYTILNWLRVTRIA